jgi:uncharacterized alkaline shock family protein YloU
MAEMQEEHPPSPRGKVKVANEVIAQIAAMTAMQVDGVAGVADGSNQIARVIRRGGGLHKGVRVQLNPDGTLKLHLLVVAESDHVLPRTAAEVQERVVAAVDRMLGMKCSAVDVHFADVRFDSSA